MRTLSAMLMGLVGVFGAFAVHSTQAQGFELNSADIAPGSTIEQAYAFNGFGCAGRTYRRLSPGTTRLLTLKVSR